MKHKNDHSQTLILTAGQGRVYHLGAMTAIFKADENETADQYSISEWWLAPNSNGPGPHQHDDQDQVFYVLEGTISILTGDKWIEADRGTFIRIPRNTIHNFANRTNKKAGMLNFDIPGGFEKNMPSMVKWFEENK
ncbi:cupin domain-containing protein [Mucilaginibacter sabulilitoris]|uniref:Cupin domain-containing protein n=1 Tax=Mucilaginibacter sabulilitoris TaxID=1173583 RepID=A0ABZ0TMM3_9SPHI|nr:cupin domain-containing protein [Mucilaginibacter sabulilitoris]WPU94104.1 cupin domain-containing protein [Mucilaginibacter sabulilitoris]